MSEDARSAAASAAASIGTMRLSQAEPPKLTIGDRVVTRRRTVTEADLVGFSSLTGDWHPQHSDAVWAEQTPFGERIAHGMLVLAYAVGLLEFNPTRVLALRRISEAVFKAPVLIGESIYVEGEVEAVRQVRDELDLVLWRWRIVNHTQEKTAVRLGIEILWRTGSDPAAHDEPPEPPLWELSGGVTPF